MSINTSASFSARGKADHDKNIAPGVHHEVSLHLKV